MPVLSPEWDEFSAYIEYLSDRIDTVDQLLKDPKAKSPLCQDPFQDVMHDLSKEAFHALLDALRREGKSVKLKAVVTGHNRKWTARRLYQELLAEALTASKERK